MRPIYAHQVAVRRTHLNPEPTEASRITIEVLFGERVQKLEDLGEWSRVVTELCEYEGFIRTSHLIDAFGATHRVSERAAPVYIEPHFKAPSETEPLYFNSLVTVQETLETPEGTMCRLRGCGWVFASQLREIGVNATDFLEECLKFLGTPYGYEKRSMLIDCSTLVQAGCIAAGIACPYDVKTGEMVKVGEAVEYSEDFSNLIRGDLVFWTEGKGSHVAIMVDGTNCLHATIADPYRRALIQPLAEVARDQARSNNGPITAVRRFPAYRS